MSLQFVAYIRVSTAKQGRSGLGIEAQREVIARFAEAEGAAIVGEHVEVETGKGSDAAQAGRRNGRGSPAALPWRCRQAGPAQP